MAVYDLERNKMASVWFGLVLVTRHELVYFADKSYTRAPGTSKAPVYILTNEKCMLLNRRKGRVLN